MSEYVSTSSPVLRVAVIGGGTAGLAAATRLKERIPASSLDLSIFEAADVLGGNNQSFEGVPLFFSCFRGCGAKVMQRDMKELGLKATSCEFTSLSLKDRSGGAQRNMSATMVPEADSLKNSVKTKLKDPFRDDSDNVSEASSFASTAESSGIADLSSAKSPNAAPTAIMQFRASYAEQKIADLYCWYQEIRSYSRPSPFLPSPKTMEDLMWSNMDADPRDYKMHTLAAGINYFYSSRDPGFTDKHVREYYHLNCGTYYWSIENGRNDLLIERMRDRLLGVPVEELPKSSCLALNCKKVNRADVDSEELDMNMPDVDAHASLKNDSGNGNVTIHCGTRCTSVERLSDGTVRLQYERASKSSRTKSSDTAESDSERSCEDKSFEDEQSAVTAIFDHVIICVAPHVAMKILKNCLPLQSLFEKYPFRPVQAHSIVHTDQSVKCTSNPSALTYEIGEDGSWILHIDAEQYYRMKKGKGNGNIVSIFYAPDTCDSINPSLIKGRFSTFLSKSALHDQGSNEDVERELRGRLRGYHKEQQTNVYLCGSYYSFEQWSQDAFAMAEEVADCVVGKLNAHYDDFGRGFAPSEVAKQSDASSKGSTKLSL